MGYTITNNIMYVRDSTGELVPISMIALGADQTIQAIKAKTDEQVARIPEVITLAEDISGLKSELEKKISTPENGTTGQVLTKMEDGFSWQDMAIEGVVLYTEQELTDEQQT